MTNGGAGSTARAPKFRLGTFEKLCVHSLGLFLVKSKPAFTLRMNGSTRGRKNSFMSENGSPHYCRKPC